MNIIQTLPLDNLGYNFVDPKYIPEGLDEYYLRNIQNVSGAVYQKLTEEQLHILLQQNNVSSNWDNVLVTENFNPKLVKNCTFYGLVRLGDLQESYRAFHDFKMPVGIYNSTIISCDIGNNVCIDHATYLSHYIIDNDVMIANVNELDTTDNSKFGNGVIKDGELEAVRTKIEICNENGGRSILPFNGMLAGDAYMWSKFRDDEALMHKFTDFTDNLFDKKRGYYGKIGERSVIKNCGILKDVWIGTDAYIKGANKIKNITINSDANRKSQIGEGCELVNGIVGYGCKIFYGVKAVRFILSSHSQLKYGARLINSFLGNNSTISCCEVLNTLIFPSHEQHHNNSFLCASMVMGQSNIAAGATIGSNHNSRSPDGEIVAGRGFWPGLCVSLKHNSKFASYTIIAKGDFPSEINIPIPFSLVSIDGGTHKITVMPAYWFMYNMYAMERNAWKIADRDKRTEKIQHLEYNYLAPDTVNEIFYSLQLFSTLNISTEGKAIVMNWENGNKEMEIIKIPQSIKVFKELIQYYAATQLLAHFNQNNFDNFESFKKTLHAKTTRSEWINIGGQLIKKDVFAQLKHDIKNGTINSWNEIHEFYKTQGKQYAADKLDHAYTSLLEILNITGAQFTEEVWHTLLNDAIKTKEWMCKGIYDSRAKDYTNPFRKMVYDNDAEMNKVIGKLEDNSFIQLQLEALEKLKESIKSVIEK